jgi:Domain of unknown function (DUF4136)
MLRSFACLALLVLSGCSTMEVGADYDPSASFDGYKTYGWVADPGSTIDPALRNDLLDSRVRSAVEAGLQAEGLTHTAEDPDLLVNYHGALQQKLDLTTFTDYRGDGHWRGSTTQARAYDEGSLILDLIDSESNSLVWRGTARDEVNMLAKPQEREAKIKEAVTRLLELYPPLAE